jgi:two-component system chemotaxis response regulator CheY
MRILLVEDEPIPALMLRRILEGMGYDVVSAADGMEALRTLESERIPLVISDWMMPGLDGPGLCQRIRARDQGSYTYVILLSVRGNRMDRMEGLCAGADDYLVKPVDKEELAVRLEIARRILDVQAKLQVQNARLLEVATTDELTGLRNRAAFRRALEASFGMAARHRLPLSLVLADVDHFKSYNDAFGHPAGDEALRTVAAVLKSQLRGHDTVARHGGEEFAAVLPGATEEHAFKVAERLCRALTSAHWPLRPVTASFGVAGINPTVDNPADLIECADQALYHSKRRGRDRVTAYSCGRWSGESHLHLFEAPA